MSFSLRTLMLFFPALIVAYGLAWVVSQGIVDRPRLPRPADWSHHDYNVLFGYMEESIYERRVPPSEWKKINSFFAGKLPVTDSDYDLFSRTYPEQADWRGIPYACVPLSEAYEPDESQVAPRRLGFYSVGPDGVSRSLGNDADDTNSWLFDHPGYMRAWQEQKAWHYRKTALWLTPLTLLFVYWSWKRIWTRTSRRKLRQRTLPKTIDYPQDDVAVPEFHGS